MTDPAASSPGAVPAPSPYDEPGWSRLLAAARRSMERSGGSLDGTVSLGAPTEAERLVVIGVTGAYRPATSSRLTVRLADLDTHLTQAYGAGLAETLAAAVPLRNRPAEARREAIARDTLLSIARDGRHGGAGWYEQWLDGLRRDGTLTRLVRTGGPFAAAVRVLDALPADDEPMPAFADRVLGDTKALSGGVLRGLVLRALAEWQQTPTPATGEAERALWESLGVVPDDLASQVLVLNIPAGVGPGGGGLVGRWLAEARQARLPVRLTLHQLRAHPVRFDGEVFVCENPAVLRAAATLVPASRPLVCTEGVPSAAVHALLRGVTGPIRWRNDFDWTGVRLTAAALARYPNAVPWRMSAEEYRGLAGDVAPTGSGGGAAGAGGPADGGGPALIGVPADTPWDPSLAVRMRSVGRAVMEERLLGSLLQDLQAGP